MALFAHQGGWDEVLLVLIPIVVIAGLVRLVQVRAERVAAARPAPDPSESDPADQSRSARDRGAEPGQPTDEVVVATIDVMDIADHGLALGRESGDDEGRAGADVG